MPRQSVFDMGFNKAYSMLVAKAVRNGRTKAEVDECICWLTGYVGVETLNGLRYGQFPSLAPTWNPCSELITGKVCSIQVVTIEDPLMKRVRLLNNESP